MLISLFRRRARAAKAAAPGAGPSRARRGGVVAAMLMVVAGALFAGSTLATADPDRSGDGGTLYYAAGVDPQFGVCRGTDPLCYHAWYDFDPAKNGYHVLVFTKTAGPRHADLGPALGPGLDPTLTAANVVQNAMIRLGQENGFSVDWTEDTSVFSSPATLLKYNAILFFTSRTVLDDPGQTSLRTYIEAGGAFIGVHNAFGTNYNWNWYLGLLGNAQLMDHGPEQTATVNLTTHNDSSDKALPSSWTGEDEWYNLTTEPTDVKVLATVNEKTMATDPPVGYYGEPGMGADHPVAWCQYYDGGRAWLTTLGHDAGDWEANSTFPGAQEFQTLLVNGIKSAMGETPFCK
ncbi:ThuA domain-containing protein [Actinospica durhamensis]|uniref:ThuA domain-containing protein n=1 Tax=Actinospica durhamensis TaxID=1508375 RepID=A0A941ENF3_9ACTN|nr:ThuA domain-containing protein [Actinospica durhamensis]MBR7834902.1 ThuA domain-containing protein [Actinospica durhamensis]